MDAIDKNLNRPPGKVHPVHNGFQSILIILFLDVNMPSPLFRFIRCGSKPVRAGTSTKSRPGGWAIPRLNSRPTPAGNGAINP
jgi:hypothetical protein